MRLSPAAQAIIDGRHADPFNYLGLHTEGDEPVVRVFLPDARQVVAASGAGPVAVGAARGWPALAVLLVLALLALLLALAGAGPLRPGALAALVV